MDIEGHEYLTFIPEPWKISNQTPIEWFRTNFLDFVYDKKYILANSVPYELNDGPNKGGVYFLIDKGIIVYIGQSNAICRRLMQHKSSGLEFTHYWCFGGMPEFYVEAIEAYYIHKFQPTLNEKYPHLHEVVIPHV